MPRLAIREGWTTIILSALLVFIAVWSIERADWAAGLRVINVVALAGIIAGIVVSKWRRAPSLLLHLGGLLVGIVVISLSMTVYLPDTLGTSRDKLDWLWDRAKVWFNQVTNGQSTDDLYLFVFFIMALTFLLGYSTMWYVLRARWIWAALFFPGIILLLNLGYSRKVPTGLVAIYLFVALLLLMRYALLQRELAWRRVRIEYPSTLLWRGLWAASYLAIFVLAFGWVMPVSARSSQANEIWQDVNGPWQAVERQFSDWFVGLQGPNGRGVGGYAAFSDSFDLGGPLQLSDTPVVTVSGGDDAPYLAAHRYSTYTGRGWESDTAQTYFGDAAAGDETLVAPQISLEPGELLPLDSRFTNMRERTSYTLHMERPRGTIVFAPETFVTADTPTNLVLSWERLDVAVDVPSAEPASVPVELWPLVELLKTADFTPIPVVTATADASSTPGLAATEETSQLLQIPPEPAEIQAERDRLSQRGITTSYVIDSGSYHVSALNYTGVFPVYGDVEAVHAQTGLASGSEVTVDVLESTAMGADLRQASNEYPQYVADRYLQLPDTITDRTRQLALDITADTSNVYDAAKAIELWLRQNITYNESIDFPPADVDVVDHVLFTTLQGYCEYYSSAFIVMARSLGIPTRMTVGFFPGDEKTDEGTLYRERNAHAWPEVYFPEFGWVAFEPTASRQAFARDPQEVPPADTGLGGSAGPGSQGPTDGPFGNRFDERFLDGNQPGGGNPLVGLGGQESVSATGLAVRVLPLVLLLGVLLIAYFWLRGTRELSPTRQLYTKLARGASWSGVRTTPAMTPREYADKLAKSVPGSKHSARYLTDLYVRETYSKQPINRLEVARAKQAWLDLRGLLLRHLFGRLKPWRGRRREQDDRW
jgi:transglutaminase-like putative cysteine protease